MAKIIRLFLSSPGDVEGERKKVSDIVAQINRTVGDLFKVRLEVIEWKTHVAPDMGRPQEVINDQIKDYDIFVGIMWKRFGTPSCKAESGTKEEFDIAYNNWQKFKQPRIFFYFSQKPYSPQNAKEAEQWVKVLHFKEDLAQKGLIFEYLTLEKFAEYLREHLVKVLQKWFKLKGLFPGLPILTVIMARPD